VETTASAFAESSPAMELIALAAAAKLLAITTGLVAGFTIEVVVAIGVTIDVAIDIPVDVPVVGVVDRVVPNAAIPVPPVAIIVPSAVPVVPPTATPPTSVRPVSIPTGSAPSPSEGPIEQPADSAEIHIDVLAAFAATVAGIPLAARTAPIAGVTAAATVPVAHLHLADLLVKRRQRGAQDEGEKEKHASNRGDGFDETRR